VLVGKLAMFFRRSGVFSSLFVVAMLVMMRRLMMVMCGGVMVSRGSQMMLGRRMLGGLRHVFVLLPESVQGGLNEALS
jgi:hypothetical protein